MKICKHCGSDKREIQLLDEFSVSDLLGAPFQVILERVVKEEVCAGCGKVLGHVIPQPDELSSIVAILRAFDANKLNGREIRFLRKSAGWKSKELAKKLSVSSEQLSRYENGHCAIGEVYERLLRALVFLAHMETAPSVDLDLSDFTEMQIRSARDANEMTTIRLVLAPAQKPKERPKVRPNVRWKRDLAA